MERMKCLELVMPICRYKDNYIASRCWFCIRAGQAEHERLKFLPTRFHDSLDSGSDGKWFQAFTWSSSKIRRARDSSPHLHHTPIVFLFLLLDKKRISCGSRDGCGQTFFLKSCPRLFDEFGRSRFKGKGTTYDRYPMGYDMIKALKVADLLLTFLHHGCWWRCLMSLI